MMMAFQMPSVLLAGPAAKTDPVAEGYPDWQGLSAKSYVLGREISPSDLRHKATIVVEIQPNDKLQEQLILASKFVASTGLSTMEFGTNWETLELPRNATVLISNRGGGRDKDHEAIKEALKYKGEDTTVVVALSSIRSMGCSVYDDVTFTGSPDTTGKRPYVYVMGPDGKEPLCQGELNEGMVKTVNAAIAKAKKQIATWKIK